MSVTTVHALAPVRDPAVQAVLDSVLSTSSDALIGRARAQATAPVAAPNAVICLLRS